VRVAQAEFAAATPQHGGRAVRTSLPDVGDAAPRGAARPDPAPGRNHAPRSALVTGAAGFIGSHLARALAGSGWIVTALDRAASPPSLSEAHIRYLQGDIRDGGSLRSALEGVTVVFHLASAHLERGAPDHWYASVNVDGVEALMRAAADAGVRRVVHTSTVGIYGHVAAPPAGEDGPFSPTNRYERTKLAGEEAALRVGREVGLSPVILRPGWVYGPGCPRTAKLLRTIHRGRFFYVGRGANRRHPLYIGDMVEAFLRAADAPLEAEGRAFLAVGPRPVSTRELVETCARLQGVPAPGRSVPRPLVWSGALVLETAFRVLGMEPPISRRSLVFFDHDQAFDGGAARDVLGFHPRVELEEGLRLTLDAGETG
jgi:nucleoside-diphosphate-sugar epimerase